MPEQPAKPKRPVIMLKLPCPKCQGQLIQEILSPGSEGKKPRVKCITCKTLWRTYKDMLGAVKPRKMTLDDAQKVLQKAKSYVRGGRNVVERIRAAQQKLRDAATAVRNIKQEGAATEVGASLEGVVDQLISSLDDVKSAVAGATPDFVGEKAGIDEEGEEKDEG